MANCEDSDEDIPTLSSHTLLALQEFLQERDQRAEIELSKSQFINETEKQEGGEQIVDRVPVNVDAINFNENWQLSQFWYDDETVEKFAYGVKKSIKPNSKIALISCPTLFKKMKTECDNCIVKLFEYDKRFSVYDKDFIFYDYKTPLNIPREYSNYFDIVIADPPYLSDECLTKTAVTIKFLTKDKIIVNTGAIMFELAQRLLNVNKCDFEPHHKNNLANEFCCFANFDFDKCLCD